MGRKKKDEEILDEELELDETDTLEEEDEEDGEEEETEEKDEASEEEEEVVAKKEPRKITARAASTDDLKKEPAAEKPAPRKRAPRAPKAEAPVAAATEIVAAPVVGPQPIVAAAATADSEPKDIVVKQWEAARQTSESIVASLEKVNSLLKELPEHYASQFQKALKQQTPKAHPGSKIAFGMSVLATLLSVLSLSFSQSARQQLLSRSTSLPAVHQTAPAQETLRVEAQNAPKATPELAAKPKKAKKTKTQ